MKLLITNDDGVDAPGIAVLARELSREHEILVVAPDGERSGVSMHIDVRTPQTLSRRENGFYACSGTPADCVFLIQLGALDFVPDAVVAGINHGPNMGSDIMYSGTCGAIKQAALGGLPGIAVSCEWSPEALRYGAAASFVRRNFSRLLSYCSKDVFINVNAPSSDDETLAGRWALPVRRSYQDKIHVYDAPDGKRYCFCESSESRNEPDPLSDYSIVHGGLVAVTPVYVQPQAETGAGFRPGREFN